jgi:hypothetical protein
MRAFLFRVDLIANKACPVRRGRMPSLPALPENDPEWEFVIRWVSDHGQSFDWIMFGDPRGTICSGAALERETDARKTVAPRRDLLNRFPACASRAGGFSPRILFTFESAVSEASRVMARSGPRRISNSVSGRSSVADMTDVMRLSARGPSRRRNA